MFSHSKIKFSQSPTKFGSTLLGNLIAFVVLSITLIGCSGESVDKGEELLTCSAPLVVDAAGTSCVEPTAISCVAPLVPNAFNDACVVGADPNAPLASAFPADDEAVLYYNRANRGATNEPNDPSYNGYVLHTWNNDQCDAYASPFDSSSLVSEHVYDGIDPN